MKFSDLDKEYLKHYLIYAVIFSILICLIVNVNPYLTSHYSSLIGFILAGICFLLAMILPTVRIKTKIQLISFGNLFLLNFITIAVVIITLTLYQLLRGRLVNNDLIIGVLVTGLFLIGGAILSLGVAYFARFLTRASS